MAIRGTPKVISWEYTDPEEREHRRKADEDGFDLELGRLVREWALLHEELASKLFLPITRCEINVGLAIWHSIRSDLSQREMLMAAASTSAAVRDLVPWSREEVDNTSAFAEVKKFIGEINGFAHRRNNLVHGPIIMINNRDGAYEMTPRTWNNSPKSFSMLGRDLIQYCRYSHAFCRDAKIFTHHLNQYLFAQTPLPNKFSPRPISQFRTRKQDNSQNTPRPPSPPPQS